MSYKITFSLVVIVTAWQGDLSRAFSEGGLKVKRSISKVCNRSLKSSVICIQRPQNAHTVRTKCVQHNSNENILKLIIFCWGNYFN